MGVHENARNFAYDIPSGMNLFRIQHNHVYRMSAITKSIFILNFSVQLLLPFSADEVLSILRQVLSAHEVNWKHLLSCVAAFVVLFKDSRCLLIGPLLFSGLHDIVSLNPTKILYVGFLRQSFASALEESSSEDFLAAMLVSRQATIEGEPFFLSYNSLF